MNLKDVQHIYFLGIGGIGMSALARYFHKEGKKVTGYDRASSVITQSLENEGMELFYMLDPTHLEGVDLMVYTPAIKSDNSEYQEAVAMGIPIRKRSEILGDISQSYRTLGVAGTHGKTSTSSLLTHLLRNCGVDCTAFLGGISRNLGSNFVYGKSPFLVVEADEFDRSFLTLDPEVAIITSVDADHLDIYGTPEKMEEGYLQFAGKVKQRLLVHDDIKNRNWPVPPLTFGIEKGIYQARNLRYEKLSTTFDFHSERIDLKDITLPFPGEHNVLNAVAALGVALEIGANEERLKSGLETFAGIYRRYEVHHHSESSTYIDDYAHHPTELRAALKTAKSMFPYRQVVAIFQPHLYSRTNDFHREFAEALSLADAAIMVPIYPAREKPMPGVTSKMVFDLVTTTEKKLVEKTEMIETLEGLVKPPFVLLTLGAGDIDREVKGIAEWIQKREKSEDRGQKSDKKIRD